MRKIIIFCKVGAIIVTYMSNKLKIAVNRPFAYSLVVFLIFDSCSLVFLWWEDFSSF